jgi:putative transposase
MVYKLREWASKNWRALNGSTLLPEVVKGTVFVDGVRQHPAA